MKNKELDHPPSSSLLGSAKIVVQHSFSQGKSEYFISNPCNSLIFNKNFDRLKKWPDPACLIPFR